MFRRPFTRPLRRAMRPDVHPLLQQANELMASGNFDAGTRITVYARRSNV